MRTKIIQRALPNTLNLVEGGVRMVAADAGAAAPADWLAFLSKELPIKRRLREIWSGLTQEEQ